MRPVSLVSFVHPSVPALSPADILRVSAEIANGRMEEAILIPWPTGTSAYQCSNQRGHQPPIDAILPAAAAMAVACIRSTSKKQGRRERKEERKSFLVHMQRQVDFRTFWVCLACFRD